MSILKQSSGRSWEADLGNGTLMNIGFGISGSGENIIVVDYLNRQAHQYTTISNWKSTNELENWLRYSDGFKRIPKQLLKDVKAWLHR